MKKLFTSIIFLLFFKPALVYADFATSFDCNNTTTKVEKAICSSEKLSNLDAVVSEKYDAFISELADDFKTQAKSMQDLWLAQREALGDCEQCIEQNYLAWLKSMEGNVLQSSVLVANYCEISTQQFTVQSPINESIKFQLEVGAKAGEGLYQHKLLIDNKGIKTILRDQTVYRGFNNEIDCHYIESINFYLTLNGGFHTAIQTAYYAEGGNSYSLSQDYLHFLDNEKVVLSEGLKIAEGGRSNLINWIDSKSANLKFIISSGYNISQPFYRLHFPTHTLIEINSYDGSSISNDFFDKTADSLHGKPYRDIITEQKQFLKKSNSYRAQYNGDLNLVTICEVSPFSDYYVTKSNLIHANFTQEQVKHVIFNVLTTGDFESISSCKQAMVDSLIYLEKAKETPDWEDKINRAASYYDLLTNVRYQGKYQFKGREGDETVDKANDPFVKQGFYNDIDGYKGMRSPFHGVSAQEWIYLFWARRLNDGSLQMTEKILRHLVKGIEKSESTVINNE